MPSVHPWKFVSSGVDLVGARLKNSGLIEEWEKGYLQDLLISSGYFEEAPFTWVGLTIRYGLRNDKKSEFQGVDKKYACLDLAKQLDMRILEIADVYDPDVLMDFFKIAALDSLIEAGKRYELNPNAIDILKNERVKLGQIPDWEYEMEDHPEIMLEKYCNSIGMPYVDTTKLVFCGSDRASPILGAKLNKNVIRLYELLGKNYFNDLLTSSGYFEGAKFSLISIIMNYGLENQSQTYFEGNNKKYEDLSLAKLLDMRILLIAEEKDEDMLMDFFKIAALDALIDAGMKYKLNSKAVETLQKERSKLGQIPDWESEMENHPEIMLETYRKSVPLSLVVE